MKSERIGLFDWKHIRLWRFASWARLLSTLVAVGYLIFAAAQAYQYNTFAHAQYQTNLYGPVCSSADPYFGCVGATSQDPAARPGVLAGA